MGDFFKNKFSNYDESESDGWDRPDADVRAAVLGRITAPPKSVRGYRWLVAAGLFLLGIMLGGGYAWQTKQQVEALQVALAEKEAGLAEGRELIAELEQALKQEKQAAEHRAEAWEEEREALAVEVATVQDQARQQQKHSAEALDKQSGMIANLQGELLKIELLKNDAVPPSSPTESTPPSLGEGVAVSHHNTSPQKDRNAAVLPDIPSSRPFALLFPQTPEPRPVLTKNDYQNIDNQNNKKIALGYEYALQRLKMPVSRQVGMQRPGRGQARPNLLTSHAQGVQVAYTPRSDKRGAWSLRAGVRVSSLHLERDVSLQSDYDPTMETIGQNGEVENRIAFVNTTPYARSETEIGIRLPNGLNLDDTDQLDIRIQDAQRLRFLQIPVGAEYLYGKGRLKGGFHGGLQWNLVQSGDYRYNAQVQSRGVDIFAESEGVVIPERRSKQFASAYAGLGMDYRMTKNLHARAGLTYQYDLVNPNEPAFTASSKTSAALKIGLDYHF